MDHINKKEPSVTVAIPALNEEEYIEEVINGFLNSSYGNIEEILIADGGSTDSTKQIVSNISAKDPRVQLVENPFRFQSFALNKMIETAKGKIFLRADAHCDYDDEYIEKCVEALIESGARNAGGSQRYKAKNLVQSGISLAVQSFLGNGGAKYMDQTYEGYGDTVFLGCFWTKDLKELAGFNTSNITNQDSELNLRLIKNFGSKSIFISPKIKSWYYPRSNFFSLFKQYFRYGRGRFLTHTIHSVKNPLRASSPFLFVSILIIVFCINFFLNTNMYSFWIMVGILTVLFVETVSVVNRNKTRFKYEIWNGT